MRSLLRTLKTALNALSRNVMRSALTTLGMIIGVAAVIAMQNIGQGSSTAVQQTIKSMGANNLLVQPGTASSGGVSFGSGSVKTLTPQDAAAIARALVNNPPLLFADEPTGNLDSKTSKEILRMFQRLSDEDGITVVLVTHDAGVAHYAKRVIRISDGLIAHGVYDGQPEGQAEAEASVTAAPSPA